MKIIAFNLTQKRYARAVQCRLALAILSMAILCGTNANARLTPQAQTGVVTRVVDGDTLWIRGDASGSLLKVRVSGIDAPEICQVGGAASRQALLQRVMGRAVTVSFERHDDYGRALARVSLQGEDIGRWMVSRGQAWSYRYRRNAGPYAAEQSQAERRRLGLFAASDAENPRSFRQRHGSCYS